MSDIKYWHIWYPQGTFSVPTDQPPVFAPELVDAIKNLTIEIKKITEQKND